MALDDEGFLGKGSEKFRSSCIDRFDRHFTLFREINILTYQSLRALPRVAGQDYLYHTLTIRIHQGCQASVLLCEYGLIKEAKVVLRNAVEILFWLVNICRDVDYATEYTYSYAYDKCRKLNKIYNSTDPTLGEKIKEVCEEHKSMTSKTWKAIKGCRPNTVAKLAEDANMEGWYQYTYSALSDEVHGNLGSYDDYIISRDSVYVDAIKYGPTTSDVDLIVVTACEIILIMLRALDGVHKLGLLAQTEEFSRRCRELMSASQSAVSGEEACLK